MNDANGIGDEPRAFTLATRAGAIVLVAVMACSIIRAVGSAMDWLVVETLASASTGGGLSSLAARGVVVVGETLTEIVFLVLVVHHLGTRRFRSPSVGVVVSVIALAIISIVAQLASTGLAMLASQHFTTLSGTISRTQWIRDMGILSTFSLIMHMTVYLVALIYGLWRWHAATADELRRAPGALPYQGPQQP